MKYQNEMWKPIDGLPNYMISNYGRVKSLNYKQKGYEQILKTSISRNGYNVINISNGNDYKKISIHRAVAKAFLPTPVPFKTEINHKDGNKLNNYYENLEWCSRQENVSHAFKNGLAEPGTKYKKRCRLAIEFLENVEFENKRELLKILEG